VCDWVRPDIPWAKLSRHPKSRDFLGWGNLEEYLISYLELKGPTPPLNIALLAAMGGSHTFLDQSYFVHGGLD